MKGRKGDARVQELLADENRSEPLSKASGMRDRADSMVPGGQSRGHLGRSKPKAPDTVIIINAGDDKSAHNEGLMKGAMMGAALAAQQGGGDNSMGPPQPGPPMPQPGPPGGMPPMPPMASGAGPAMMPPTGPMPPMPPMKRGGRAKWR